MPSRNSIIKSICTKYNVDVYAEYRDNREFDYKVKVVVSTNCIISQPPSVLTDMCNELRTALGAFCVKVKSTEHLVYPYNTPYYKHHLDISLPGIKTLKQQTPHSHLRVISTHDKFITSGGIGSSITQ